MKTFQQWLEAEGTFDYSGKPLTYTLDNVHRHPDKKITVRIKGSNEKINVHTGNRDYLKKVVASRYGKHLADRI